MFNSSAEDHYAHERGKIMETVTVKDVEKSDRGWFEISLEDGRTVSTRNSKLADAAFAGRGTAVEVEINESKNGSFTNYYLNKLGDVSDERKGTSSGNGSSKRINTRPQDDGRQQIIEREWAMGRAVELYTSSLGGVKNFAQLGESEFAAMEAVAERLLKFIHPK
jgi:flagellar basal body rod protein FlgG